MATYYDKKKLIEDSSDVYISDYDKNLDYSYLSDIIDQKRAYAKAEEAGDTAGMKKANDRANSIRMQAASYVAGEDGSKYNRVKRPYEENEPKWNGNKHLNEKEKLYKMISSYGDFKYDVYSDPLYEIYKDIYLSLGDDAYERALGENYMRTGGTQNTSAISAAMLAKGKYNTMLANIVPELYDQAYSRYRDGLEDLYNRYDMVQEMDDTDYERYKDSVDDFNESRDYYYQKDKDISDDLYAQYSDETNLEYDMGRDAVEDQRAQDEFDLDRDYFEFDKEKFEEDKYQFREEQKQIDEDQQYKKDESQRDDRNEKLAIAVNLAKALYGRVPVSKNVINNIIAMLQ